MIVAATPQSAEPVMLDYVANRRAKMYRRWAPRKKYGRALAFLTLLITAVVTWIWISNRTIDVVVVLPEEYHGAFALKYVDVTPVIEDGAVVLQYSKGAIEVPTSTQVFELFTHIRSAHTVSGVQVPVASTVPFPESEIAVRGIVTGANTFVLVVGTANDYRLAIEMNHVDQAY